MTRKVRLTDYNQRIEVPQGAALFLEGGDIVVDGEIGSEGDSLGIVGGKPGYAPGGGGGGFSPTITDPQDGDVLARVGGVWVNSGNLKVGAQIEIYGTVFPFGAYTPVGLDTAHTCAVEYLRGLSINNAKNGLVVETAGRYLIVGNLVFTAPPDATHQTYAQASISGSPHHLEANAGQTWLLPASDDLPFQQMLTVVTTAELAAGDGIQLILYLQSPVATADWTLNDGYLQVAYLGPGASFA